jgi:hypothetical protein
MVSRLVIFLMLAASVRAEYFTGTNSDGRVVCVPTRTDPALAYVVGAIATSSVPYAPEVEIEPVQSVPLEMQFIVLQDQANTSQFYGVYISEGEIVGGILDHASPRDRDAIKARLQAERTLRGELRRDARTIRTNMVALSTASTTAAGQQQQIEELRKAVRDLSAIIRKQLKDPAP